MYFVYAIHNSIRSKIYIGYTKDLANRILRHNGLLPIKRKSYTSKQSGQWSLFYEEHLPSRQEAIEREKELKSSRGRMFLWQIIKKES